MSDISRILLLMVSCVFTQNVVLARLLGVGEAMDERRSVAAAAGLGVAVAAVMALASLCGWIVYHMVLVPLHAEYLELTAFALLLALLAWLAGLAVGKAWPALEEALGDSMPMIAVNCAVLGVALVNIDSGYGLGDAFLSGLFNGLGFLLAVVLMAGVQERLRFSRIPRAMKGLPISLVSASLMALAFMGFLGMGK